MPGGQRAELFWKQEKDMEALRLAPRPRSQARVGTGGRAGGSGRWGLGLAAGMEAPERPGPSLLLRALQGGPGSGAVQPCRQALPAGRSGP